MCHRCYDYLLSPADEKRNFQPASPAHKARLEELKKHLQQNEQGKLDEQGKLKDEIELYKYYLLLSLSMNESILSHLLGLNYKLNPQAFSNISQVYEYAPGQGVVCPVNLSGITREQGFLYRSRSRSTTDSQGNPSKYYQMQYLKDFSTLRATPGFNCQIDFQPFKWVLPLNSLSQQEFEFLLNEPNGKFLQNSNELKRQAGFKAWKQGIKSSHKNLDPVKINSWHDLSNGDDFSGHSAFTLLFLRASGQLILQNYATSLPPQELAQWLLGLAPATWRFVLTRGPETPKSPLWLLLASQQIRQALANLAAAPATQGLIAQWLVNIPTSAWELAPTIGTHTLLSPLWWFFGHRETRQALANLAAVPATQGLITQWLANIPASAWALAPSTGMAAHMSPLLLFFTNPETRQALANLAAAPATQGLIKKWIENILKLFDQIPIPNELSIPAPIIRQSITGLINRLLQERLPSTGEPPTKRPKLGEPSPP